MAEIANSPLIEAWCCDCDGRCRCFCHAPEEAVAQHHRELWAADVAL